ncbi:MAG: exodeoxyribonuclease VII small subunit [Gammaproteobacteria bacterium]|nr:exodeoxyribonuclease VII small subunit [Gammaproteobacteria bacterium]
MARKKNEPNFEKSLEELETLVETMENGDTSLEDSLKHFERGIELTRLCQKSLKEATQKVEILIGKDRQNTLKPFTDLAE